MEGLLRFSGGSQFDLTICGLRNTRKLPVALRCLGETCVEICGCHAAVAVGSGLVLGAHDGRIHSRPVGARVTVGCDGHGSREEPLNVWHVRASDPNR